MLLHSKTLKHHFSVTHLQIKHFNYGVLRFHRGKSALFRLFFMKNTFIVIVLYLLFFVFYGCKTNGPVDEVKVYYNDFLIPDNFKSGWEKFDHLFQPDTNYVNEFGLVLRETNDYSGLPSTLGTNSKMIGKKVIGK